MNKRELLFVTVFLLLSCREGEVESRKSGVGASELAMTHNATATSPPAREVPATQTTAVPSQPAVTSTVPSDVQEAKKQALAALEQEVSDLTRLSQELKVSKTEWESKAKALFEDIANLDSMLNQLRASVGGSPDSRSVESFMASHFGIDPYHLAPTPLSDEQLYDL